MKIEEVFTGMPVSDLANALRWYERLMGRLPDLVPNDNEGAWQLAEHAWVYVVGDPDRAGKGLLTLLVDDVEAQVAELAQRGLATDAVDTIPGVVSTAEIRDPDGNRITFGEPAKEG